MIEIQPYLEIAGKFLTNIPRRMPARRSRAANVEIGNAVRHPDKTSINALVVSPG